MSAAEEKLQRIRAILDQLESKIGEIRDVFRDTPASVANPPIFPEPFSSMLSISDEGNAWIVRPREFLRKDDFAEIARIVRQYRGEYVSAGKSSYFRIQK